MYIHVVQEGDTIETIASMYGISSRRMVLDNGLIYNQKLVIGQTIVIEYPLETYIVQTGDTLYSIAAAHGVCPIQLLQNNPYLSDREYIYAGETIVIRYNNSKGKIATNGYVNTFVNKNILKKTLPYLTYLSIFGYRATETGDIIGIDDSEIISIAKQYGVAPMMFLSTLTGQGVGNADVAYLLLYNEQRVEHHIDTILFILKEKGYYGVNLTLQFLTEDKRVVYENFITKLTKRLNNEGFVVFVSLVPNTIFNVDVITFEKVNYCIIGQEANGVTLINYNWGFSYGPPAPVVSEYTARKYFDYAISMIPPRKIDMGVSIIGYDWQLPYVMGITKANSLTTESAISLAYEVGAIIEFDEVSKTPYYKYTDNSSGVPRQHIVWFVDARSIDTAVNIVFEYGFSGIGIWNIMNYFSQLWFIINTQHEIEKLLI